jgi:hypothetical protein
MSRQGDYVVEPKLDGDRLMLHFRRGGANGSQANGTVNGSHGTVNGSHGTVNGSHGTANGSHGGVGVPCVRVEWWSRNRKNYTSTYRDSMGPVLDRAIPKSVTSCLVDGEMMAVDLATGRFLPFGEKQPSHNGNGGKGSSGVRGMGRSAGSGGNGGRDGAEIAGWDGEGGVDEAEPCGARDVFVAFDLLWLNGQCLAGEPLRRRRELLRDTFAFEDHHFELIPQKSIPKDTEKGTQRVRPIQK